METTIEIFRGREMQSHLGIVAEFRLSAFKAYPYLYEGSLENEQAYLKNYLSHPDAILALAKIDSKTVGVLTGIPLASEFPFLENIREEFKQKNFKLNSYYYFGEIIVDPKHAGLSIPLHLYSTCEKLVQQWGFTAACMVTVKRSKKHPLRPKDYKDPDILWNRAGFKESGYGMIYPWATITSKGTVKTLSNKLSLLIKPDLKAGKQNKKS